MFEWFDHTADLGMRVRAADLPELFRDAARGLFAMIVEPEPAGPAERYYPFEIVGQRYDYLLVDWLSELLYVFDTERMLLGGFEVSIEDGTLRARAAAYGAAGERYRLLREVKAITYHGLRVERAGNGWLAEVIVDI
jgi:SHS2 domain-containing protein